MLSPSPLPTPRGFRQSGREPEVLGDSPLVAEAAPIPLARLAISMPPSCPMRKCIFLKISEIPYKSQYFTGRTALPIKSQSAPLPAI